MPKAAFRWEPPGGLLKGTATVEQLAAANEQRIRELGLPGVFIFTDGSVSADGFVAAGGFVVAVIDSDVNKPRYVYNGTVPGGRHPCAYTTEIRAIEAALKWLVEPDKKTGRTGHETMHGHIRRKRGERDKVHIVTDSQSALRALVAGPLQQTEYTEQLIWEHLAELAPHVSVDFSFVFSHARLAGNDEADALAREAANFDITTPLSKSDAVRARIDHWQQLFDAHCKEEFEKHPAAHAHEYVHSFSPEGKMWVKLPRWAQEILLAARVGIVPWTDGVFSFGNNPKRPLAPCPICGKKEVFGRGGRSIEHIFCDCPLRHDIIAQARAQVVAPDGAAADPQHPRLRQRRLRRRHHTTRRPRAASSAADGAAPAAAASATSKKDPREIMWTEPWTCHQRAENLPASERRHPGDHRGIRSSRGRSTRSGAEAAGGEGGGAASGAARTRHGESKSACSGAGR